MHLLKVLAGASLLTALLISFWALRGFVWVF